MVILGLYYVRDVGFRDFPKLEVLFFWGSPEVGL